MNSNKLKNTGVAARLVLVLALVFASFAHTAYAQNNIAPAGFDERAYAAQFTLPDGTLPILCNKNGNGDTHHASAMPCEFCSLSDNTDFTPINASPQKILYRANWCVNFTSQGDLVAGAIHGLHGASRAPPRI